MTPILNPQHRDYTLAPLGGETVRDLERAALEYAMFPDRPRVHGRLQDCARAFCQAHFPPPDATPLPDFFVVWCPRKGNPFVRHSIRESAEAEATRLASIHPGKTFHVLAAVAAFRGSVVVEPVKPDSDDDELPF